jgi:hypothetical protein
MANWGMALLVALHQAIPVDSIYLAMANLTCQNFINLRAGFASYFLGFQRAKWRAHIGIKVSGLHCSTFLSDLRAMITV